MAGRRGRDRFTRRRRSNRPGNSQAKEPPVFKTLKNGDVLRTNACRRDNTLRHTDRGGADAGQAYVRYFDARLPRELP